MSKLTYIHQMQERPPEQPAYLEYFKLSRPPFETAGNDTHEESALGPDEAVQKINLGMTSPGITVLTGTEEAGNAAVIERAIAELTPDISIARFLKAPERPHHFLAGILEDFGFEPFSAALPQYRNVLARFLEHKAQSDEVAVVVIEQSELLSDEVVNEIQRLFSEGSPSQGVHVLLVGQPGLVEKMQAPFSTLECQYLSINSSETVDVADYVFGRLNAAGLPGRSLITQPALSLLREASACSPRVIDDICHHALRAAAAMGLRKVNKRVIEDVLAERDVPAAVAQDISPVEPEAGDVTDSAEEYRRHSSLIMTRDGKRISRFELTKPRLLMGRHKSNDIYIPRPGISLFHAVLVVDGRDVFLFDLRSTNGTTVNGLDVARRKLVDGDVITFGSLSLKFCQGINGISELPENSMLPGFIETVVLEESDTAEPTMYMQRSL